MKLTNWILFAVTCFASVMNIFSQTKQITKEEYYQPFQAAIAKASEISHRRKYQENLYKNGKQSETTTITDEFLKPDKKHLSRVEKSAERNSKNEIIQIGEIYYCREDNGEWTQSRSWCLSSSLSSRASADDSKFTTEETKLNGQNAKLFQNYSTYKRSNSQNKDMEGLSYVQYRYWLNGEGLLLRYEIKSGLSKPETIYSQEVTSYEYNPKNLKIEAPIK